MANPTGARVEAPKNVEKSEGKNNKGVEGERPRFWMKLRNFLNCVILKLEAESNSSSDKTILNYGGARSTNVNVRDQPAKSPAKSISSSSAITVRSAPPSPAPAPPPAPDPNIEMEINPHSSLRRFTFHELNMATRNFSADNVIGEGGFGTVLKGWLTYRNGLYSPAKPGMGIPVAVKSLNKEGLQGHREWLAEVDYLGNLRHPNLVKLVGFCIEGSDKRLLVYEFMPRGSLENHMFRRALPLPWSTRIKIMLGAAKGLAFLHEEAERPVIYRDFKSSNILLDVDYTAKLSDFGLARDAPVGDATHVSTRVLGTKGYCAPEYMVTGHLSPKSDVYSFGMVLLEMLTGRKAIEKDKRRGDRFLMEWARPQFSDIKVFIKQMIDPRLEGYYPRRAALKAMRLASECLRHDPKQRPLMSEIVQVLMSLPSMEEMFRSSPQLRTQGSRSATASPLPSKATMHASTSSTPATPNKYGLAMTSTSNAPFRFQASPYNLPLPSTNHVGGGGRP